MSDENCHKDTCGGAQPRYWYDANWATDPHGATDAETDAGVENPNCPEGYIWGGENCVKDDGADTGCSDGYYWNGVECVEEDDGCADGYMLDGNGDCVPCALAPFIDCIAKIDGTTVQVGYGATGSDEIELYVTYDGGTTWQLKDTIVGNAGASNVDIESELISGELAPGTEMGFKVIAYTTTCEQACNAIFLLWYAPAAYPETWFGC